MNKKIKSVALIVAHPDDETLWAGGLILNHPTWEWFIVALCRKSDLDRAPKFYNALERLKSEGTMGDLDDGFEQNPLSEEEVEQSILSLLPPRHFDLVITHNPAGEYTKHLRHEEISRAVITLWESGKISAYELWAFAYEDGNKAYFPRPNRDATIFTTLSRQIWLLKHHIITKIYGFEENSWESKTTPKAEAFWRFSNIRDAKKWLIQFENKT